MNISSTNNILNSQAVQSSRYRQTTGKTEVEISPTRRNNFDSVEISSKKEVEKVENTSSLPDSLFYEIREMAKEGAKKGVYMGQEHVDHVHAYMRRNISPDRGKLKRMFAPLALNSRLPFGKNLVFKVSGFPSYKAMFQPSPPPFTGGCLQIKDKNGDTILSYSPPPNAGWSYRNTREENAFLDETTAVYSEAYSAARAEMRANGEIL